MKINKFLDIPQFTKQGSFQVNVPFTSVLNWIETMQKDMDLQLNPDFQRGHVWVEEQQIAYIEFLLKGGKSSRIICFNCPYWNSGKKREYEYKDFVCVDGLQRITAVTLFMDNKIKVFGSLYHEFTDKIPLSLDLLIIVNDLKTKKEVLQWYIEMNTGGTPHTKEEIAKVRSILERLGE